MHPEIDNPDYVADSNLYKYTDISTIGFDLWQVKAGTIFDNVLVAVGDGSTPVEEARKHADETWAKTKVAEKTMKDEIDEKEKKAAEEAEKKRKEEGAYISTGHSPPTHTRTHSVCSRSPSPIARSRRV